VIPDDPESVPWHVRLIMAVVAKEGPVHVDVVDMRLRDAWALSRIGPKVRSQIDKALAKARLVHDGDFLLAEGSGPNFPTRMNAADFKREISQVYIKEIEETAYRIVQEGISISLEDLVTSTAHCLGFTRLSADVRNRVVEGISNLQESEWLSDGDETRITVLL